jgi:ABC-type nitrate/sulfonate/bicarbonate transport system substrate-binding protein
MNSGNKNIILAIIILGVVFIAGIIYLSPGNQPEKPLKKVRVQLKWRHQAQFAGFYAADQLGYYKERGIEVELIPGGPGVNIQQALIDSEVDFTVMGGFDALLLHNSEAPVKVVQSIYQVSPSVFISPAELGISKIEDFAGRKIGMSSHAENIVMLNTMMKNKGVDSSTITEVNRKDTLNELMDGKYDITACYIINELLAAKKKNIPMSIFLPSDYGVNAYGDVLVTTDNLIETNKDLVRRFIEATLLGWEYMIENPEEAPHFVAKYNPDMDFEHEQMMMLESLPLLLPSNSHFGHMDAAVWQSMADMLLENDLVDSAIESKNIFLNDFCCARYH